MSRKFFELAAEVKLHRRLQNLLRLDDKTEIDTGYISCAEYQLFIDDMRKQGKNYQPDHWTTYRFETGMANQPITGARGNDAELFCQWLSERSN